MIEDLLAKRLIFVTGKGGVGKSTVAATLAWKLSQQGKETCLIQLNREGRLPQYFGEKTFTYEPLPLAPHLYGMGIDPRQALREYVIEHIHLKLFYELVFENRIMHFFLDAAPGVEDLAVMGKIWTMVEKRGKKVPGFDILVVDCPAFGHAQLFLQVAQVIQSMVPVGPVRQNAEKIQKLLNDRKKTVLCLVTILEELPVQETLEFYKTFSNQLTMGFTPLILNKCEKNLFSKSEEDSLKKPAISETEKMLFQMARFQINRKKREDSYASLLKAIPLPHLSIPVVQGSVENIPIRMAQYL